MTEQPAPPTMEFEEMTAPTTPDEFYAASGAHYGGIIGPLIANNLELSKHLAAAHAHIAQITANQDVICEEKEKVIQQHAQLEAQIDQLIKVGPTVAQSAARDLAEIKEKPPHLEAA